MSAPRPPLQRANQRILAGVCGGVAEHLGVKPGVVRVITIALTAFFGAGIIAYLVLWALMPGPAGASKRPANTPRPQGGRRLSDTGNDGRARYLLLAASVLGGVVGVIAISSVPSSALGWGLAGVLALCGAALAWGQLNVTDGVKPRSASLAVGVGWALAAVAFVAVFARQRPLADVVWALFASAVLLAVTALILFPMGARFWRETSGERADRVREAEREEIAAHLHDSVLQTLALIRSRSHDPQAITALARSQERELREWLYSDATAPSGSLATQIENLVQTLEVDWQVPIDVVTVGDATEPRELSRVIVAASREAITNAARHGREDVRVFAEFTPEIWEVFVRDRGAGFDVENISPDRRGVRDSITGRMSRHGGTAKIRSSDAGTEVHLRLPVPARLEVRENG